MNKFRLCAFADEADSKLDGQIEALHNNRISLLEIRGVDGKNIVDLNEHEAKEVYKRLSSNDIQVWSIGSPIGKVSIHQDAKLELERFKRVLEDAVILKAKCIRLFSFFETNGDPVYKDEVLLRLSDFVAVAKESGVVLCHENEKGIYGDIPERCVEIHNAIPEIKAVFDPANYIQCGQNVLHAWNLIKPYTYYGHIKDCNEDGTVVAAGEGCAHMDEYLPELLAKDNVVLTVEPHLQNFVGLKGLENPGEQTKINKYRFDTNTESFKYAVDSLRNLLESIHFSQNEVHK